MTTAIGIDGPRSNPKKAHGAPFPNGGVGPEVTRAVSSAAAEIKVRAERRAGELLAELPRSGGPGRGKKNQQDVDSFLSTIEREGIQHQTAQRWQAEAIIPEKQFEKHLAETKAEGREITSSELVEVILSRVASTSSAPGAS